MKTQCPNCKAKFNVDDKFAGKQAKCPKCTKPFTIEPFIEKPVTITAPPKSPETVAPPAENPKPVEAPAKSAKPIAPPVESPEPIKPQVKIAEPPKEEKPEPKALPKAALSKIVFVYCWVAIRIIAGIFAFLGLMLAIRKVAHSTLIATFTAADVFLIISVAIELMLFYRMWAAIRDNQASISPGKAVGFLFIPVFNIYWALCMLIGFAEDYNAFIQRRSIKTKELPITLFMIYAFMFILTAIIVTIPMICVFAFVRRINSAFVDYQSLFWLLFSVICAVGIGHFIAYILIAVRSCNAINALPQRQGR
jgi:predicted Zn finger-like uncharacterized protein